MSAEQAAREDGSHPEPGVRGVEQDKLAELIDEYTGTHGAFTAEELAAARADLYGPETSGG
jgi:hypothetical protein